MNKAIHFIHYAELVLQILDGYPSKEQSKAWRKKQILTELAQESPSLSPKTNQLSVYQLFFFLFYILHFTLLQ